MARSGLLSMIVLATIGYSAGLGQPGAYDDPEIHLIDKTGDYDSHRDKMAAIIEQNKHFMSVQNLANFRDVDPEPTDDDENCRVVTTIEQPYVIHVENDSLSTIVQLNDFEQKIVWTKCYNPKKTCFGSVFSPGIGDVETQCGEKYGAVSLYVYDPQYNVVRYKMFPVPIACVCKFKSRS